MLECDTNRLDDVFGIALRTRMVSMEPSPGTSEAVNMATWESDRTVLQIPCDGKVLPTDVTRFPTHGDLLEVDEGVVDTGNERANVR